MNSPAAQDVELSKTSEMRAAALLILTGAALRVLSFFYSANTGGDAAARAALTAIWLKHPGWKVIFDAYPPGHFWLMGALATAVGDVTLAGRLLSLALGIASLYLLWRLARVLYGGDAAILSLAVFSFYTLHIAYSTTSSSEVSYLFFLLFSVWLLFSYLHGDAGKLWKLAASGVLLSISESIRYEAWAIFFGLSIILGISAWRRAVAAQQQLSRMRQLWPLAVFGVAGGLWPGFMMWYCKRNFGDPMYLVHWNHVRVIHWAQAARPSLPDELALSPIALTLSLSLLGVLAAAYGLARSFVDFSKGAFAILLIFFAALQNYQILTKSLEPLARYSLTLGTLLAVVSGYGLRIFWPKFIPRVGLRLAGTAVFLTLNAALVLGLSEHPNPYAERIASISPRLRFQVRIATVAKYLSDHLQPHDAVVIDNRNFESNIIASASGLPIDDDARIYLASKAGVGSAVEFIESKHPRYLVYSGQGTLQAEFQLPPGCENEAALRVPAMAVVGIRCRFSNEFYRVYELSYR